MKNVLMAVVWGYMGGVVAIVTHEVFEWAKQKRYEARLRGLKWTDPRAWGLNLVPRKQSQQPGNTPETRQK